MVTYDPKQSRSPFVVFRSVRQDGVRKFFVFQLDKHQRGFTVEFSLTTVDDWALEPFAIRARIGELIDIDVPNRGRWRGISDYWWEWSSEGGIGATIDAMLPQLEPALECFKLDYEILPLVRPSDPANVIRKKTEEEVSQLKKRGERLTEQRRSWWLSLTTRR